MISDYYEDMTKKVFTTAKDSGGAVDDTTSATGSFRGYPAFLSAQEVVKFKQNGLDIVVKLFTEEVLAAQDQVQIRGLWYEVVGPYDFFHRFYDLKLFRG